MFDENTLTVTYQTWRGEPRGSHKPAESWEGRGDCVDCKQCIAACPTGIDIRDGQQLECIGCGLCIDACNEIMDKVGRPRSLITSHPLERVVSRLLQSRVPIIGSQGEYEAGWARGTALNAGCAGASMRRVAGRSRASSAAHVVRRCDGVRLREDEIAAR